MNLTERLLLLSKRPIVGCVGYFLLKVLGVEFPRCVPIGMEIALPHGAVGLVVHESTRVGNRVVFFQGVTVGRADQRRSVSRDQGGGVVIGNDVVICAGAKILFKGGTTLVIGDRATIGANAVVLNDVGADEVWAGVPARLIKGNR